VKQNLARIRVLIQKLFNPIVVTINQVVGFSRICGGLMGSALRQPSQSSVFALYLKNLLSCSMPSLLELSEAQPTEYILPEKLLPLFGFYF
jgi:hypothetical protein